MQKHLGLLVLRSLLNERDRALGKQLGLSWLAQVIAVEARAGNQHGGGLVFGLDILANSLLLSEFSVDVVLDLAVGLDTVPICLESHIGFAVQASIQLCQEQESEEARGLEGLLRCAVDELFAKGKKMNSYFVNKKGWITTTV